MRCGRCQGQMVREVFYSDDGNFVGFRCVTCGEVIDDVILKNREWSENGGKKGVAEAGNASRARVFGCGRNVTLRGGFKHEPFL